MTNPSAPQKNAKVKTFILDTNVLLHDPGSLLAFEENTIVITQYVLGELDRFKRGNEEINHNAREASRTIKRWAKELTSKISSGQTQAQQELTLATQLQVSAPIQIPETGGKLLIMMDDAKDPVRGATEDDKILNLVLKHKNELKTPIIVVSKDTVMGFKALGYGFGWQDYLHDQAKTQLRALPKLDIKYIKVNELFSSGKHAAPGILKGYYFEGETKNPILPGYYIVDFQTENDSQILVKVTAEENIHLINRTPTLCRTATSNGVCAKNLEQKAAVDALLDPQKALVCLMGPAGTGKTLLAIAAALHTCKHQTQTAPEAQPQPEDTGIEDQKRIPRKMRKQMRHNREPQPGKTKPEERTTPGDRVQIYITRPNVSMGKELGFLPGTMEEKMNPWMQPIYDNINFLLGPTVAQKLLKDGIIQLQPLQYIRGRTLHNAVLIIDESQNLTPLEAKTIITRAGHNCRIIMTGDPAQIDNPYIDRLSNGLTYTADRMHKEPMTAVVPLIKGERSELSAKAAELL